MLYSVALALASLGLGRARLTTATMGADQFEKPNNQFYRHVKPKGSPFASIARVVAAAIRRRRVVETAQSQQNYYHGSGDPIEAVGCLRVSQEILQNRKPDRWLD
ncbi:hypothetical protein Peur_043336 [Populus x canadensis]